MTKIMKWDGKPISAPGAYSGMPIEIYHSANACVGPSVSASGLKQIELETPAHYWFGSHLNPNRVERKETPSLKLGAAVHNLFLGEAGFKERFAVQPATYDDPKTGEEKPWNGNANVCKDWKAKQIGRTILSNDQFQTIRRMADSLASYPNIAGDGLLSGEIETTLAWQDEKTGVWLRNRPDVMPRDGWIVDLKTISSADMRTIQYAVDDYGYDIQLGLGAEGALRVLNVEAATFVLVFIETSPPYAARLVELTADKVAYGRARARRGIEKFAACLKSGTWPAYEPMEVVVDVSDRNRSVMTSELGPYLKGTQ